MVLYSNAINIFSILVLPMQHKVLTYGVFRTIDPPLPLLPASVSSPCTTGGHSPGGEGVWVNICGRRQTLDWPLTV